MAEIWTIGRILKWTEQYFKEKGMESPRLDAEVLLAHVLQKERIYLYVHFDEPLEAEELGQYRELIKGRVQHVPVAYLVGSREFMGLDFRVTPAVLIPRPDTEILVQAAIERLRAKRDTEPEKEISFADIGTGSGAICLSVLYYTEGTRADTVDLSGEALEIGKQNAERFGLSERISFYEGDLLQPLSGRKYQAILSNPPYIPEADLKSLAPEVREKEPRMALAGGPDGLDIYRRIVSETPDFLETGGFFAVEVGIHQAESLRELLEKDGRWKDTEILSDLAGIARVVIAWKRD